MSVPRDLLISSRSAPSPLLRRPRRMLGIARACRGDARRDPKATAMLIAGMMVTAFGLLMAGFAIAFATGGAGRPQCGGCAMNAPRSSSPPPSPLAACVATEATRRSSRPRPASCSACGTASSSRCLHRLALQPTTSRSTPSPTTAAGTISAISSASSSSASAPAVRREGQAADAPPRSPQAV